MRAPATLFMLLSLCAAVFAQDNGVTDIGTGSPPGDETATDDLFIGSEDQDTGILDDSAGQDEDPAVDSSFADDGSGAGDDGSPVDEPVNADDGNFVELPADGVPTDDSFGDEPVDGSPQDGSDVAADTPAEAPLRQKVERPAPDPAHQALREALNKLSATPVETFKGFRDRPLFTPSRTAPPKVEPPTEPDPEPLPDEPVAPDEPASAAPPNLQLMGVIDGDDQRIAVMRDNDAGTTVSVRSGDMIGDWQVGDVEPSSVSIRLDDQVIDFRIFQPGDDAPPPDGFGSAGPGPAGDDMEPIPNSGDASGFIPPDGVGSFNDDGSQGDDIVTPDAMDDPLAGDDGNMIPENGGFQDDAARRAPDGAPFAPDRAENILKLMQQMRDASQP